MTLEPGVPVEVAFEATFVEQIHNRVHPDHERVVVQLWDGTHLMLPIGARLEPRGEGES